MDILQTKIVRDEKPIQILNQNDSIDETDHSNNIGIINHSFNNLDGSINNLNNAILDLSQVSAADLIADNYGSNLKHLNRVKVTIDSSHNSHSQSESQLQYEQNAQQSFQTQPLQSDA